MNSGYVLPAGLQEGSSDQARLRILYIGDRAGTSLQRARALERLSHDVTLVDPRTLLGASERIVDLWLYQVGAIGADPLLAWRLRSRLRRGHWDVGWVDIGDLFGERALAVLRRHCRHLICFNQDNPAVARDKRRWRLLRKVVGEYDVVVTPRESTAEYLRKSGAKDVRRINFSADEEQHIPIPLSEADRVRFSSQVAFVGTWAPERGPFLADLLDAGVPLRIFGARWEKAPEFHRIRAAVTPGHLHGSDYVKAIRGATIAICLVSKGNEDLHTTRSIEIPAIGTLLCAERTPDHSGMYAEGVEAAFFSSTQECAKICRALLADPRRAKAMADAGRRRVLRSGNFNEQQLARILAPLGRRSETGLPTPDETRLGTRP